MYLDILWLPCYRLTHHGNVQSLEKNVSTWLNSDCTSLYCCTKWVLNRDMWRNENVSNILTKCLLLCASSHLLERLLKASGSPLWAGLYRSSPVKFLLIGYSLGQWVRMPNVSLLLLQSFYVMLYLYCMWLMFLILCSYCMLCLCVLFMLLQLY